ncbi:MAG TPA: hypothetical protein VF292_07535 [Rhodanobacteraceae bacterium]
MDKRPEGVPEWIWGSFQYFFGPGGDTSDPTYRIVESVLRDKDCAPVWKAIDARKNMLWVGGGEPYPRSWVVNTLVMLAEAAQSIPRSARVPLAERRADGKRIREHALTLRRELDALRAAHGFLLGPFGEVATVHADHCVHEKWDNRDGNADAKRAFFLGAAAATEDICGALQAIADAADAWSATKPTVARPSDPNAVRLFFIRTMTTAFREAFNTPLRASVAALANSVYACELTAQDVAKLAP